MCAGQRWRSVLVTAATVFFLRLSGHDGAITSRCGPVHSGMDGLIDEWKAVASISGVQWTEGGMENSEEEERKQAIKPREDEGEKNERRSKTTVGFPENECVCVSTGSWRCGGGGGVHTSTISRSFLFFISTFL